MLRRDYDGFSHLELLRVWTEVTVIIGAQKRKTRANNGSWRVVFKPLSAATTGGAAPLSFAVQDASGTWFRANARIEGNAIVLSNPDVAAPQAVRYAWANNPAVNLVNAAGLPANPFRTDTGDLSAPIMVAPVAVTPATASTLIQFTIATRRKSSRSFAKSCGQL